MPEPKPPCRKHWSISSVPNLDEVAAAAGSHGSCCSCRCKIGLNCTEITQHASPHCPSLSHILPSPSCCNDNGRNSPHAGVSRWLCLTHLKRRWRHALHLHKSPLILVIHTQTNRHTHRLVRMPSDLRS